MTGGADPRRRPLPARARQRRADREDGGRARRARGPRPRCSSATATRGRPTRSCPCSASPPARPAGAAARRAAPPRVVPSPARGVPRPRRRRVPGRAAARARSSSPATCSSPTCCSRLRRRARVVYEAHAVESILYGERGDALRHRRPAAGGQGGAPAPARGARLAAARAAFVATTAGIRDTFAEAVRRPRARVRVVPNGCDVPADRDVPRPRRRAPAARPVRRPALSVEGRGRAGGRGGAGSRRRAS